MKGGTVCADLAFYGLEKGLNEKFPHKESKKE
jgi:hypothetical protein